MKHSIITVILLVFMTAFDATPQASYPNQYQGPKSDPDYVWLLLRADSVTESGGRLHNAGQQSRRSRTFG